MPALTTWVIMLKRRNQLKRHQARPQAKREVPLLGETIKVTDDDGAQVLATVVASPRYDPPTKADAMARYIIDADEVAA
jgi:hypothetical protein